MAPTWLAPIVAGVVVHAGIQLVEIDMFLPYIGMSLGAFWAICLYLSMHVFGATIVEALLEMLRFSALVTLGLTTSMLVYRGFFHRLRRFPGPWPAKFTKLYAVWLSARKVQWHLEMKRIHEEYGDVVRTGPRELSITRAEAIAPLAACRKSTLYALSHWNDDRLGLIETRSIRDHRLRRKPWDTALNSKALAKYDPSLQSTIGLFLDAIATAGEAGQKPINVTDWVAYLAYDLMGMIGFGRDFGQLRGGGVEHWAVKALRAQQLFIGVLKPIPWLLNFLAAIPGADGPVQPFVKYCAGLVAEKREAIAADQSASLSQPSDICTHILQAYEAKSPNAPRTQAALDEDGRLIVIAGADTTSNTLINALYYLSRRPTLWRALQSALAPLFPGGPDTFSYAHLAANLAQAPLLDAIINETMRLKPATPGGNPRVTPTEGLRIVLDDDDDDDGDEGAGAAAGAGAAGGRAAEKQRELHIPGSTDVYMSPYVLHRSPRYFSQPDAFVPERWIADRARGGRPELIKKPGRVDNNGVSDGGPAFFPFQVGQFACAGKALAMWEMRSVLARMALRFDLGYERSEEDVEGKRFDEGMKDTFTMTLGPMWLRFKERGRWWEEGSG